MTSLSGEKFFITYEVETALQLGNKTAAALMARLSYWFSKYEKGFYKFMEPCSHALYKKGDSWTEELGVARRTLNRAFDLIGIRYKSKRLFSLEKDPFQGKMFASYVDNDTNQTFYLKNPAFFKARESLSPSERTQKTPEKKRGSSPVRRATDKMTDPYKETKQDFKKKHPPKSPLREAPCKGRSEERKNENSKEKIPETEEPFQKPGKLVLEKSSRTLSKAHQILEIFNQETQGQVSVPPLTPHFATRLLEVFQRQFSQCWEKWRLFCRVCASSPWLMGKTPSRFKAWLIWLVKDQVIEAIRQGRYGVRKDLPLVPEKKYTAEEIVETLRNLPEGQEREKRLMLLKRAGGMVYQRLFASMKIECLFSGRFLIEMGSGVLSQLTSDHKALLLDVFEATSFEAVPAGLSAQSHILRWNLQAIENYPYLFLRG